MSNKAVEPSLRECSTQKPLASVLCADSFRECGIKALKSLGCKLEVDPSLKEQSLVDAIAASNPDILVVRSTKVTAEMLDASEKLSVVVRAGAGYDTIDVAAASERSIFVANCPSKNSIAVAELAWSLILSCDRRVPDQVVDLRAGKWNKKEYAQAKGLHGRTLGVVGLGGIGREVASRGRGFGMKIAAWSQSLTEERAVELDVARCESLIDLARVSDVVTVHVASTPETENLINAEFLDAMQDGATLINTSRGKVVDENALVNAVRTKRLRVGLDVFLNEPLTGEDSFTPEIVSQCCVYGTHHIGASTDQAQDAITMEAVRIISEYVSNGTVPNCVNRAASTPAKAMLSVRHKNHPGVLSHVFDSISHAGVNVEEMENIIYDGAKAACARIQLGKLPTQEQIEKIRENKNIFSVTVSKIDK